MTNISDKTIAFDDLDDSSVRVSMTLRDFFELNKESIDAAQALEMIDALMITNHYEFRDSYNVAFDIELVI